MHRPYRYPSRETHAEHLGRLALEAVEGAARAEEPDDVGRPEPSSPVRVPTLRDVQIVAVVAGVAIALLLALVLL